MPVTRTRVGLSGSEAEVSGGADQRLGEQMHDRGE